MLTYDVATGTRAMSCGVSRQHRVARRGLDARLGRRQALIMRSPNWRGSSPTSRLPSDQTDTTRTHRA